MARLATFAHLAPSVIITFQSPSILPHCLRKRKAVLASVAQWIEDWPTERRVSGSIGAKGIYLGCSFNQGGGNQSKCLYHINASFSLGVSPPSLLKYKKYFKNFLKWKHTLRSRLTKREKEEPIVSQMPGTTARCCTQIIPLNPLTTLKGMVPL